MSVFSWLTRPRIQTDDWKKAEGVLPVERALADEHEAMHGDAISPLLEAVTLDFDAAQFVDIPALARDLRNAAGSHESPVDRRLTPRHKLDSEVTPRDAVGKFLLEDAALMAALVAFESADAGELRSDGAVGRPVAHERFAAALATSFNKRLGQRLMDEPACRPFVQSGAVDALGEAPAGSDAVTAQENFYRRANRELLEAVFPRTVALMRDRRLAIVFDAARKRDTAALCLSGGGIRSSTFALGIMQGLARHGLLGKFDYLSTVSGGGLSGGWLSAWMRREGANTVHDALRTAGQEKIQPEPEPVQGLRAFSHWLTPTAGALSVDSWTVIATVLRNLLLNWLVLIPLLCGLVLLPRLLLAVLAIDFGARPSNYDDDIGWVILAG
ncbi:MAG TPA: patatin-like phospholipase family protein, partial [Gemmatimonadaceae bacterium]|nr:patatin-like phospholipase family protein [Gemmatimonadaceae bacterium]